MPESLSLMGFVFICFYGRAAIKANKYESNKQINFTTKRSLILAICFAQRSLRHAKPSLVDPPSLTITSSIVSIQFSKPNGFGTKQQCPNRLYNAMRPDARSFAGSLASRHNSGTSIDAMKNGSTYPMKN